MEELNGNLEYEKQKLELIRLRCEIAKDLVDLDTSNGKELSAKWISENIFNIKNDNKKVL